MTAATATATKKIFINMSLSKLANDANNNAKNKVPLKIQFNGQGRKIISLEETQEKDYLYYSSDKAGNDKIVPPFEINNGEHIKFKLQLANDDGARNKDIAIHWRSILQNKNDLHLTSKKKRSGTFLADVALSELESEKDDVFINMDFSLCSNDYAVIWDPRVIVKK